MTGDEWRRLHPLTPVLRGWRILLVLVAAFGQQGLRQDGFDPAYLGLGVLAATGIGIAGSFVSWRQTRYRVTATELQIDSGVLQRRSRRMPVARLQTVDVVRPVVARVLGLAELRLEVVGGGKTEAPLAYLAEDDAQQLRARLLAAASGRADSLPDAHEGVLVRVPTGTLVVSAVLGPVLTTTVVMVLVAVLVAALESRAAVPVLVSALPVYAGVVTVTGRRASGVRLHGRRGPRRASASARAARHPEPDDPGRARPSGADHRAVALAPHGMGARRGRRRRLRHSTWRAAGGDERAPAGGTARSGRSARRSGARRRLACAGGAGADPCPLAGAAVPGAAASGPRRPSPGHHARRADHDYRRRTARQGPEPAPDERAVAAAAPAGDAARRHRGSAADRCQGPSPRCRRSGSAARRARPPRPASPCDDA